MITACPPHAHWSVKENPAPSAEVVQPVSIETIDPLASSRWDDHVAAFADAGVFHDSKWAKVLNSVYGFRPLGLVARCNQKVVALLPSAEVDSPFTGRRGVSLPFADECPPMINRSSQESLNRALVDLARARQWRSFEVRGSLTGGVSVPSVSFRGHRLDLTSSVERLWENVKAPVRTAVRRAEAAGVAIEFSTTVESLREFYRLYGLTRRRQGHPLQPFAFFSAIHEQFLSKGVGEIVLAQASGRCVAAAIFLQGRDRVLFKYGVSDPRFQQLRANNLLFWTSIKRSCDAGFKWMEFGRTSLDNEGLRRFKASWGATEYPIHYTKYDVRLGKQIQIADQAEGWHTRFFRLTPCWLSARVGKVLYKHLA